MNSRDRYGYMPTLIGIPILVLMALALVALAPKGEPAPDCSTTNSCSYFSEESR